MAETLRKLTGVWDVEMGAPFRGRTASAKMRWDCHRGVPSSQPGLPHIFLEARLVGGCAVLSVSNRACLLLWQGVW